MNTETINVKNAQSALMYRPRFSLFHPNGKGTGCAIQMELHPAHDKTDGSIMLSAANQMTVGDRRGPTPSYPRFDWENKIIVKLDFNDLSKILQVFRGETESLEDGKGLFHVSSLAKTKIMLRHILEPVPAYSFEMYRTGKNGEESRIHFIFNNSEALGLCESIAGSMSIIAFGIPIVIPRKENSYVEVAC